MSLAHISKKDIVKFYITRGHPIKDIASRFGTDYRSVWQRIMRLGILRRRGNRRLRLAGMRFGMLRVVKLHRISKDMGATYWRVVCDCGETRSVLGSSLTDVNGTRSCGCNVGFKKGSNHHCWNGHHGLSGSHWSKIKEGAIRRHLSVGITIQQAWELFESQHGKCALSGIPIRFAKDNASYCCGGTTASLDRIDPKHGYIKGNVQWVHKSVNIMKGGLQEAGFIELCRAVAREQRTVK